MAIGVRFSSHGTYFVRCYLGLITYINIGIEYILDVHFTRQSDGTTKSQTGLPSAHKNTKLF